MASPSALVALQEILYRSGNPTRRWLHCIRREWIIAALRLERRLRASPLAGMLWTQYYVARHPDTRPGADLCTEGAGHAAS